jgi:formyl-CoA transferase
LKVIDLSIARAGPTAVRHLADWGADVVRVEQPPAPGSGTADDIAGGGESSDYQNLHRNKRSLYLNLKDPAGRAVLLDLVKTADVLVENMRPRAKKRLRIAYEDLSAVNPRLVYGSIGGFGQVGPYSDRAGLDHIAQGMTGLMSVNGFPGSAPLRVGIAVGDLTAGNMLALNIMMALYERQRTGRGRWVHTSLLESLTFMMDFQATRWLIDREVPHTVGNEHPTAIPTEVFPTADGQVNLAAAMDKMWRKMCEVMERPAWAAREDWATMKKRSVHRAEIHAHIAEVTRTRPSDYWIEKLNAAGVPCGPIYTVEQVFADEQVKLLQIAAPVVHPTMGPLQVIASPLNFDGLQRWTRRASPNPGADTDQILADLGYSEDKIKELHASGAC